jgi:serine/threonine protein kinase, bacterial
MKNYHWFTVGLVVLMTACVNNTIQAPTPVQTAAPTPIVSATTESQTKTEPVVSKQPKTEPVAPTKDLTPAQKTRKPSCEYATGNSVEGQPITVDICSIESNNSEAISFTYYLGNEKVDSLANCTEGSWTTFPEKQIQRPQSAATQKMLDRVCSAKADKTISGTTSKERSALIFDPPSNIRVTPNGEILCSIKEKTTVIIKATNGDWHNIDICGASGWIKADQLKF